MTHCISVAEDLTWTLHVHGHVVHNCAALSTIPEKLCTASLNSLLGLVEELHVCAGHPDAHFLQMAEARKGKFISSDGGTAAVLDTYSPVQLNGTTYTQTIRTTKCELLSPAPKCFTCVAYRPTLRATYHRLQNKKCRPIYQSPTTSHVNDRFLTTPECNGKMKRLRGRLNAAEKNVQSMKQIVARVMKEKEIQVDSELSNDLEHILREETEKVRKECNAGSFQRLFWEQQLEAMKLKDKRQIRWHPLLIKWCLNLKLISSAAYHTLRTSGVLTLPSERTLRDYSNVIEGKAGFQVEVTQELVKEIKLSTLNDSKKHVALVVDELKIMEDLVYNRHSGEIVGFVNLGSINNQLIELELQQHQVSDPASEHPPIATHMLVVMVRGIFVRLNFPYAHFPTDKLTADQLFPIMWEAVQRLEACGLKVIAITADGASVNRKFFRMHGKSSYKSHNPFTSEDRYVYFVSDAPHLLKTTRNCFSHSFGHGRTRTLWVCILVHDNLILGLCMVTAFVSTQNNGQYIKWEHIEQLYRNLTATAQQSHGLSLLPKLKLEHVCLTSYSRMRVDLATQV